MARILGIVAAAVILLVGIAAVYAYNRITSFDVERVTDDVHVIYNGIAGNVGVLGTETGAVVVDTMTFRLQGRQLRELAEKLGGGPTQAIINTHYHRDHTHGNPAFAVGARFVATQRTRDYLMYLDAEYWQGAAEGTLPNETFEREHEMRVGGKTIRSYHVGPGHTGGDLVVLFVEDRVLHAGDLLFHREYPFVDVVAGGSLRDWIAALERVLELDFDVVIPGHGEGMSDREGVKAYQSFLRELWTQVDTAVRAGKSLEETLNTVTLSKDAGYQIRSIPFVMRLDRDFAVRHAYLEATGALRPAQIPRRGAGLPRPGSGMAAQTPPIRAELEDLSS
jgi:glyoxylase-like metal-dependent hydrolase (beta-lactamase superfamily II)